jgi:hypothetical protein
MTLSTFGWIHTLISLLALLSGIVAVIGLFSPRDSETWTATFLVTAVVTSATGFGFPFDHFMASHWVGVIALVVLALMVLARYVFHLAGAWRWIYAAGMVVSLYFLALVAVDQAYRKVPALAAMPQSATYTQVALLLIFIVIGVAAARLYRPATPATA